MFGLQEKVASLLTPIFQDAKTDELFAYQVACRSLQAYEAETRADFVNAGRTIAFGLASMVLLKEVFNPDLQLEDKKRAAIHANALNRSADQAERSMMERRRYRRAYPTFPVPQQPEPDDAAAETQVKQAVASYAAAQPIPSKPEKTAINLAPPPIEHSAIRYGGPHCATMPPKRPDTLITPAVLHAINPNSPTLHPG
jgi:hypothetical protein